MTTEATNTTAGNNQVLQLSDAALGGIIGGAVAGLVVFLMAIIGAAFCYRSRKVKFSSRDASIDTFTYVKQVNSSDGNWSLPSGSSLTGTPKSSATDELNTTPRIQTPEATPIVSGKRTSPSLTARPETATSSLPEVNVVVEKRTEIRNCTATTAAKDAIYKNPVSVDTVVRDSVAEDTVARDTQSINVSLSEDYCDRVIDEAFGAIDNFGYCDNQSGDLDYEMAAKYL